MEIESSWEPRRKYRKSRKCEAYEKSRRNPSCFSVTMAQGYSSKSVPGGTDNRTIRTNYALLSKEIFALIIAALVAFSERDGGIQYDTVARCAPSAVSSGRDAAASTLYLRISTFRLGTGRDFIYSRPHGISGSHLIPDAPGLSGAAARRDLSGKTHPSPPLLPSSSIRRLARDTRDRLPPPCNTWFTWLTVTIDFELSSMH